MKTIIRGSAAGVVGRGVAGIAGVAIGLGVMLSASGAAWADAGMRHSAGQGEVRAEGDQGAIRLSVKAVPQTRAHGFGDFGNNDYLCRSDWTDICK